MSSITIIPPRPKAELETGTPEKCVAYALVFRNSTTGPGALVTTKDNINASIGHNPNLNGKLKARILKAAHNNGRPCVIIESVDSQEPILLTTVEDLQRQAAIRSPSLAKMVHDCVIEPYTVIEPKPVPQPAPNPDGKGSEFERQQLLVVIRGQATQIADLQEEAAIRAARIDELERSIPELGANNALLLELQPLTSLPDVLKDAETWFAVAAKELGIQSNGPAIVANVCGAIWKANEAKAKDDYSSELKPEEKAAYESLRMQGLNSTLIKRRVAEAAAMTDPQKALADKDQTIKIIQAVKENRIKEVFGAVQPTQEILDMLMRQDLSKLKQELSALEDKAKTYKAASTLAAAYSRVDRIAAMKLPKPIAIGSAIEIDGHKTRIITPMENQFFRGFLALCANGTNGTQTAQILFNVSMAAEKLRQAGIDLRVKIIDKTLLRAEG